MTKIYTRVTSDRILNEWTQKDEREHQLFCEYVWKSDGGRLLVEFSFGKEIREKIEFIKQFARETGFTVKDLLTLFMEKIVFKMFQIIGWNFKNLFAVMKRGFDTYKNLQLAIADFVGNTRTMDWTKDTLIELNRFLKTNPKTKRIAGIAVTGLIFYIWLQMTLSGKLDSNFDISNLYMSISGNNTLYGFFDTPSGVKVLSLFALGKLDGLSFSWHKTNIITFETAIFNTLAKYFKKRLTKGDDLDQFEAIESYKRVYK